MRIVILSLLVLAAGMACTFEPQEPVKMPESQCLLLLAAGRMSREMSIDDLAGQLLMVGVSGKGALDDWNRQYLEELCPGAFVLFGFNIAEYPWDLRLLTDELIHISGSIPCFIAIDHEGGQVFRFRGGLTKIPFPFEIGERGASAARLAGMISAKELLPLGINMNLAPVVEALDNRNSAFLGKRAWAGDYKNSASLASAFLAASQELGLASVVKHFPGNAAADPHRGVSILDAGWNELSSNHIDAFRTAIEHEPAAILLSHAIVIALDGENPVTLSELAISYLKDELGFTGIVLTDDILMAALGAEKKGEENTVAAIKAGADMVMVSGGSSTLKIKAAIIDAIHSGELPEERARDAAARIILQKLRFLEEAGAGAMTPEAFRALVDENRKALSAIMD